MRREKVYVVTSWERSRFGEVGTRVEVVFASRRLADAYVRRCLPRQDPRRRLSR